MRPIAEGLKRDLRLIDVIAIGLNGVIGTGIFFLPGHAAALLGPASLLCFLISALLCTLLVLCFAEVGSRFHGTGGPMLYSREAFGDLVGFGVGWITWVVRITAWAALANAFVNATATLWPGAAALRPAILCGLFVVLTAINITGVRMGALVTNLFTAAKLLPILFFVALGTAHVDTAAFTPFAPHGYAPLADGTLLILYAFVGFEVLTVPAGEMRDPRRSVPRALSVTIALVTVAYVAIWAVATGTHPTLAGSDNPVAEAAAEFMGPVGARLVALGIFLSVLGINAGSALVAPRCLFALAHAGWLPRRLAAVHPRTRTPVISILLTSVVGLVIALSGSFVELAVISVVARFAQYIPTCLALPVLRRRSPGGADAAVAFRVPFGPAVAGLAIVLCVWLLAETEPRRLLWGLAGLVSGFLVYLPIRLARRPSRRR